MQKAFRGKKLHVYSLPSKVSEDMRSAVQELRASAISDLGVKGMKAEMPLELTSGGQAILLMLRLCDTVSLYGVSTYMPVRMGGAGYQYAGRDNLRFSGEKFHDWILEAAMWRTLNAAGVLSICSA
mmetsp:Transcript_6198/g.10756  ORF Transcript_6198/g.10756 Transcript_6198/m.10756 type:complete len:126 (+) Transcript_6198:274-651(+)